MTVLYTPFTGLDGFPPGLRLFQNAGAQLREPGTGTWNPSVDVFETENEMVLKADLPEVAMNDIHIRIEDGALSLQGERKLEKSETHKSFHRSERSYGSFARYFSLPDTVDTDKAHAALADGALTITLPKKEIAKPKTVKVEVRHN